MKLRRQSTILRLVRGQRIESQETLRAALAAERCDVTQATLSRDLRELGLSKLSHPDGGSYYSPHPSESAVRPGLGQVVSALLVKVEGTGPLIVIRTAMGGAPAEAASCAPACRATTCPIRCGRRRPPCFTTPRMSSTRSACSPGGSRPPRFDC